MGIRLAKESKSLVTNYPEMQLDIVDEKNNIWRVTFVMGEGTVYVGESYTL